MALNSITKKSNQGRDIKYLNKDFASFRQNLIDYAKTYFPKTYSDFNESSPGMMFIEMASYIGDVLSYYVDDSLKESLMLYAEDKENVIALSNYLGYKPKVTSPAVTTLSVYQLVPSKLNSIGASGDDRFEPDSSYYLRIKEGMLVSGQKGVTFRTTEMLDFNVEDDREISVYQRDTNGPTLYLVKKYVNAISAVVKTQQVNFGSPDAFSKINLADTNVIDIYDVRDSNGNKWYEVPYLAQEMVFIDYPNSEQTDKDLVQFKDSVPNILKLIKTSRRFVKQINPDNTTSIIFGGGTSTSDETLIPNFKNVGLGLNSSINRLGSSFDPANFLKTQTYGQSPSNTQITVSYLVGGGIQSNVPSSDLIKIDRIEFEEDIITFSNEELRLYNSMKSSVAVENEIPATGGRGAETIEEIRENSLANFGSQNRAVTRKDYQVRALSLPAKYGGIAKAYCAPDGELDNNSPSSILANPDSLEEFTGLVTDLKNKNLTEQQIKDEVQKFLVGKKNNLQEKNNPFAINLYVLGYDSNKNLSSLNRAVKENLKTYLNEYRLLTDGVNLLDGFIINIGVDFEIRVYGGYNKREVLTRCINELKEYFNIDNWTFNMAINISEVELLIAGVEGVQSVPKCEIVNKCLGSYSKHSYNIQAATKGKMVYPSLDPSVFEVKFPNRDIKGRAV
jgi:hypothetical protein